MFRQDINGLRAIAVIAVVLYHFNPSWLPGGFSGVDVFFVISGYLMTSIIFNRLENQTFTLIEFYRARGKRIVPPLALLCIVLMIFGWFQLYPSEYKALGKYGASSIAFVSNFIYANKEGYFTAAATENWLLHTWSLSVEWQFYIVFPLLILLLRKFVSRSMTKGLLVGLSLISFALACYGAYYWPDKAFYHLPTRAWELLVGGLIFLYPLELSKEKATLVERLGLGLIAAGYLTVSTQDLWPSWLTLLPVLGTAFVIIAARQDSMITNNRIFQYLGKTSYSIYLWHWPICVYLYHAGLSHDTFAMLTGILASILAGHLSYTYIEQWNKQAHRSAQMPKPIVLFMAVVLVTAGIYTSKGAVCEFRPISLSAQATFVEEHLNIDLGNNYFDQCNAYHSLKSTGKASVVPSCVKKQNRPGIFLWGDSHAQALSLGLRHYLPSSIAFYQVASSGCKPSLTQVSSQSTINKACNASNQIALTAMEQIKPDIVLIAQADKHHKTPWQDIQAKLKHLGVKKVIILGPVPQWRPSLPFTIAKRHWNEQGNYLNDRSLDKAILATNGKVKHQLANGKLEFISVIDELCQDNNQSCQAKVGDQELLVFDYGHLTPQGSLFIARQVIYPKLINHYRTQNSSLAHQLAKLDLAPQNADQRYLR